MAWHCGLWVTRTSQTKAQEGACPEGPVHSQLFLPAFSVDLARRAAEPVPSKGSDKWGLQTDEDRMNQMNYKRWEIKTQQHQAVVCNAKPTEATCLDCPPRSAGGILNFWKEKESVDQ